MSPEAVPIAKRQPQKCGICGGVGHNRFTCTRKPEVSASGAPVRKLAPGVTGAELAELAPIIVPPGAQHIPVILDVRVIVSVEVRK